MEKNIEQLTETASKSLEEVKGLKRIDKLLRSRDKIVIGFSFTTSARAATDTMISFQETEADLIIMKFDKIDSDSTKGTPVLWYESLHDFRKQVYIPVIISIDKLSIDNYRVDLFCQQTAALAIDGILITDLTAEDFEKSYKSQFDKYGLSFIPVINDFQQLQEADKAAYGFILVKNDASLYSQAENTQNPVLLSIEDPELISFGYDKKPLAGYVLAVGEFVDSSIEKNTLATKIKYVKERLS